MGCSSSTQTLSQEGNRPGTKAEESNGASNTIVAQNQNRASAEDCETIADQVPLPIQSFEDIPCSQDQRHWFSAEPPGAVPESPHDTEPPQDDTAALSEAPAELQLLAHAPAAAEQQAEAEETSATPGAAAAVVSSGCATPDPEDEPDAPGAPDAEPPGEPGAQDAASEDDPAGKEAADASAEGSAEDSSSCPAGESEVTPVEADMPPASAETAEETQTSESQVEGETGEKVEEETQQETKPAEPADTEQAEVEELVDTLSATSVE
ncbi:neuromodulin [Lepisosteus oculatus]|uniref:neuromodulin n=1 Tax=Lepisosteus oculatus TaxID=7918 RepID=UPI0003EA8E67|nr:PREDICTED: sarcalumenin-like [Lepisosteus oculatus]